ncbi:MAG: hypothetical protein LBQ46_11625 [Treponema sp.]|jgi:hypothetical protein|nr:hypothetical protein [Treponema sp.]
MGIGGNRIAGPGDPRKVGPEQGTAEERLPRTLSRNPVDRAAQGPGSFPAPAANGPRHLSSLIADLKLPPGNLSLAILSFAKFFSLPLDAAFLGKIRQKALGREVSPGRAGEDLQVREARVLAGLAAAAKGVGLSPEALDQYARALLYGRGAEFPAGGEEQAPPSDGGTPGEEGPDPGGGHASTGGGSGDGSGGGQTPAGGSNGGLGREPGGGQASADGGSNGGPGGSSEKGSLGKGGADKTGAPDPRVPTGPVLDLLNRLPGKDGKRWVVLPFSLEGMDICLRVLLAPPDLSGPGPKGAYRAERLGLDIRDREWSWSFILLPGPESAVPSVEICRRPAPGGPEAKALERELAGFLGIPPEKVRSGGGMPVFAESRDWTLRSLNEEV